MMTNPKHEAFFQELTAALKKHDHLHPEEMLAVAANWLGKLTAFQDQRTMTPERAMMIIATNIEFGNQQAVYELKKVSKDKPQ